MAASAAAPEEFPPPGTVVFGGRYRGSVTDRRPCEQAFVTNLMHRGVRRTKCFSVSRYADADDARAAAVAWCHELSDDLGLTTNQSRMHATLPGVVVMESPCGEFIFDYTDLALVARYTWHLKKTASASAYTYVYANTKTLSVYLMGSPPAATPICDHIDGDPTNNQRSNLRWLTRSENMLNCRKSNANTSGETGVSWHVAKNGYCVNWQRKGHTLPSSQDFLARPRDCGVAKRRAFRDAVALRDKMFKLIGNTNGRRPKRAP